MSEQKVFLVERFGIGKHPYAFTFEDACRVACNDSVEWGGVMMVRRDTETLPTRVYIGGRSYEYFEVSPYENEVHQ